MQRLPNCALGMAFILCSCLKPDNSSPGQRPDLQGGQLAKKSLSYFSTYSENQDTSDEKQDILFVHHVPSEPVVIVNYVSKGKDSAKSNLLIEIKNVSNKSVRFVGYLLFQ